MLTQQAQCVQAHIPVLLDLIIEALRSPRVRPKHNGHCLSEVVQLRMKTQTHSYLIYSHYMYVCMGQCVHVDHFQLCFSDKVLPVIQ